MLFSLSLGFIDSDEFFISTATNMNELQNL